MVHAALNRVPARPNTGAQAGGVSQGQSFVAPVRGWIVDENIAAQAPGSARIMDDCFPEQYSVRIRNGCLNLSNLGTSAPVESLMSYAGVSSNTLFATSAGSIYNVSTIPASEVFSGLDNSYFSYVNFATLGGQYLIAVNGVDDLLIYDGSSWQAVNGSSSPFSITGVDTSTLIHVASHKRRLFFTQRGSLMVYYLGLNSLGGEVQTLNLASVFRKGGAVLFCDTWSVSVGDGMQDQFVAVSTKGEVAVYQGSDPGNPSDWGLVGQYEMPRPLGRNAYMRAEGDLAVSSDVGPIRLSTVFNSDPSTLQQNSIARPIVSEWMREVSSRIALNFEVAKWDERGMGFFTMPSVAATGTPILFVVNLNTGAWARYTGWNAVSIAYHDGLVYFGTSDGKVQIAEAGGSDNGVPYYPTVVYNWDHLGAPGNRKSVSQARATYLAPVQGDVVLGCMVDYQIDNIPFPNAIANIVPSLWDAGQWDQAEWDSGTENLTFQTRFRSVGRSGVVFAPYFRTVCNGGVPVVSELVEMTIRWSTGRLVI